MSAEYTTLPVDALRVWQGNPRKTLDQAKLHELAASIRARGVDQPATVRPLAQPEGEVTHEILAGQRRWLATQLAGLSMIPVRVRRIADDEALELALAENAARADVSPIEEAESIEALLATGRRADQVADKLGRDLRWVEGRRRLLALVPAWRERVAGDRCPLRHAELLARLEPLVQEGVAARFSGVDLPPFLAFESAVRAQLQLLRHAPFVLALGDETYPGGSCEACPKRSDKQANLFVNEPEDDAVCLDTACWTMKVEHLWKVAQKDAKKRRLTVITDHTAAKINPYTGAPEFGSAYVSHYRGEAAGAPVAAITRLPSGKIVELYDREAVERAEDERREAKTSKGSKSSKSFEQRQADNVRAFSAAEDERATRACTGLLRALRTMAGVRRLAVECSLIGEDRALEATTKALGLDPTRAWADLMEEADELTMLRASAILAAFDVLPREAIESVIEAGAAAERDAAGPLPELAAVPVSTEDMVERYRVEIETARSATDLGAAWEAIVSEDHRASQPALAKLWSEKAERMGLSPATLKKMGKSGQAPAMTRSSHVDA